MEQNHVMLIALAMALAGCASQAPRQAQAEIPQEPLTVRVKSSMATDTGLRIVNRAATAKATTLHTVAGFLGAFGGRQISTFKKEQLKGEARADLPSPSLTVLPKALETRLRTYADAHPAAKPPVRFEVEGGEWLLVYQELSNANTLYELRYTATVWARPANNAQGQQRSSVTQVCQPQPQAMAFEAWQADDFAEVKQAADAYAIECADAFAERFPDIFYDGHGGNQQIRSHAVPPALPSAASSP